MVEAWCLHKWIFSLAAEEKCLADQVHWSTLSRWTSRTGENIEIWVTLKSKYLHHLCNIFFETKKLQKILLCPIFKKKTDENQIFWKLGYQSNNCENGVCTQGHAARYMKRFLSPSSQDRTPLPTKQVSTWGICNDDLVIMIMIMVTTLMMMMIVHCRSGNACNYMIENCSWCVDVHVDVGEKTMKMFKRTDQPTQLSGCLEWIQSSGQTFQIS